jgi:hypothetical protein
MRVYIPLGAGNCRPGWEPVFLPENVAKRRQRQRGRGLVDAYNDEPPRRLFTL